MQTEPITLTHTIEAEWLSVSAAIIGSPGSGLRTPDLYILVHAPKQRRVRVDLYRASEDTSCFEDVRLVGKVLTIGCGHRIHFVEVGGEDLAVMSHNLGSYFGHFLYFADSVIVASAERVFRFTAQGSLLWRSDVVGIDGVIVDAVDDERICGKGEWDPPGGWRPFCLDLANGVKMA
jgi:hypothetical protein